MRMGRLCKDVSDQNGPYRVPRSRIAKGPPVEALDWPC